MELERKPEVVTCFLLNAGDVLLFKRSENVGTYRGKWAAVSGYVERHEKPEETALKEIWQETGLGAKDVKLVKQGKLEVADLGLEVEWVIHTFLFEVSKRQIQPNYESVEHKWVKVAEVENMDTVPKLWEGLSGMLK